MTLAHTTTAFQQTLNTLEAVFQSTQWLLELTGFDDTGSTLDLAAIEGLISQTTVVLWDIHSLDQTFRRLFALDSAVASTGQLYERLGDIRQYRSQLQGAAWQLQTLGFQLRNTLADIRILWERILRITGNKQGQQQIQTLLVEIQKTDARTELSLSSYHQVVISEHAEQLLIDESICNINAELFATMPRRR